MYPTKYDTPLTGLAYLEYYPYHNVYHPGVDFNKGYGNDDYGQDVVAPRSGFVEFIHNSTWNSGGLGKIVVILHDDGSYTRSAHLKDINVIVGQRVKEGDLIGHVGNTGTVWSHLHFEVFNKKCANWQKNHWRPWRAYPSGWAKYKVQEYYLNPWEWLKEEEKPSKTKQALYLFEMISKLKSADLMDDSVGIDSKVSVRDMRKYLNYFLTNK